METILSEQSSTTEAPEVLQFPHRNLRDIPACLRRMADQIETGEISPITSLIIVAPINGDWPSIFGFGEDHELDSIRVMGWLELAKLWFVNNIAERT